MSRALSLIQVKYAERTAIKSRVFHEYAQHGLPDGELAMDYNYWIVRDGETVILLDTGYDVSEAEWLGEREVTAVPETLDVLGIDPSRVSLVVLSHYHFDHIGWLRLFPHAQVVAGRAEDEFWFGKLRTEEGLDGEFVDPRHLIEVQRARDEGRLTLIDAPTEIHPGIVVHPVSGHCPGQLLALVDTASGPRIVASDVAHFYEQIEHGWTFFVHSDLDDMRRSFETLRDLGAQHGAEIIPGHDARVRDRYPALPGAAGRFANLLG
ncbi:N-acyl homoserine lactonase family protein [Herbiconiux sp. CPCC 203407]|uniref:N-acyl homoserine lactonase family protein n=1 Tax=Herbiconiux oxytropis TaxID=2970915 RepID=A0AA42BT37_9MICO|nr:N-acyl homoserine lactonase family protein [Herbiconiux oxytropis]MCS5723907.1 N-acyl homoserine lactonase family protein [Herbiconiux oxytropis]MCS5725437.1 N-acyl homoserine lactonase family protein [Herbiconiux oxytropis]